MVFLLIIIIIIIIIIIDLAISWSAKRGEKLPCNNCDM